MLKFETGENQMKEAICLKRKTYSLLLDNGETSAGGEGTNMAEKWKLNNEFLT